MKSTFWVAFVCFIGSLVSGCNKDTRLASPLNAVANMLVNTCDTFIEAGNSYTICFDSVANESRCPTGATCVWEGVAKVNFTLKSAAHSDTPFSLYTGAADTIQYPNSITLQGLTIHFDELTPHPAINILYEYSSYRATLAVSAE